MAMGKRAAPESHTAKHSCGYAGGNRKFVPHEAAKP
jgi:hypothetical protein